MTGPGTAEIPLPGMGPSPEQGTLRAGGKQAGKKRGWSGWGKWEGKWK